MVVDVGQLLLSFRQTCSDTLSGVSMSRIQPCNTANEACTVLLRSKSLPVLAARHYTLTKVLGRVGSTISQAGNNGGSQGFLRRRNDGYDASSRSVLRTPTGGSHRGNLSRMSPKHPGHSLSEASNKGGGESIARDTATFAPRANTLSNKMQSSGSVQTGEEYGVNHLCVNVELTK